MRHLVPYVLCVLLVLCLAGASSALMGPRLRSSGAPASRRPVTSTLDFNPVTVTGASNTAPVQLASAVQFNSPSVTSSGSAAAAGVSNSLTFNPVGRLINGVPVYSDDFTGADGTLLAAHDSNWTSFGSWDEVYSAGAGRLKLSGGLATTTTTSGYGGAYYAASTSDTVRVTVKAGGTTGMKGVTLRSGAGTASATGIGYQIYLSNATGGNWKRLTIARNGTVVGYGTSSASAGSDHTITAQIIPQSDGRLFIYGYIDHAATGSSSYASLTYTEAATAALPPGHPGIFISGAGTAADNYLDNWSDQ